MITFKMTTCRRRATKSRQVHLGLLALDKLEETDANDSDAIAEGAQLQSLKDHLGHLPNPVMTVSLVLKNRPT